MNTETFMLTMAFIIGFLCGVLLIMNRSDGNDD